MPANGIICHTGFSVWLYLPDQACIPFCTLYKIRLRLVQKQGHGFDYVYQALTVVVFLLTTLPYGFWNKEHNGVFSITSMEGGGGLIHSAQWAFKMPGYREERYWGNAFQYEIISEKDTQKVKQNIIDFNKEWDYIDSCCKPYITQSDSEIIKYMAHHKSDLWMTYNAKYTLERERILKQITIKHYKQDQWAL